MEITSGIEKEPFFVLVYGTEGIGKTGLIAEAPRPIILDPERGSLRYNVARNTKIRSYWDVKNSIAYLRNEKHDFKTLGIDSIDHIEPFIFQETVARDGKAKNIEEVGGGFQKGYVFALDVWREVIEDLRDLRTQRGMNVVCIAHSRVVTANDPTQQLPYDRYTLKLHENKQASAIALWKESVDALLFATYEDVVFKVNSKDKKGKSTGEGVRKLYTTRTSAWDAKNRFGLPSELPFSLGDSWGAFERAAQAGEPDSLEQVKGDIASYVKFFESKDKSIADRISSAVIKADGDLGKLIGIRNGARILESQVA